jgi:hypothetical protein
MNPALVQYANIVQARTAYGTTFVLFENVSGNSADPED